MTWQTQSTPYAGTCGTTKEGEDYEIFVFVQHLQHVTRRDREISLFYAGRAEAIVITCQTVISAREFVDGLLLAAGGTKAKRTDVKT